jgi:PAS domain-containing protein
MPGYLYDLPALVLLDRLPIAMLGVGPLDEIAYANAACAQMLGYLDGETVARLPLAELLTRHSALEPSDCVATLQKAGVVHWNHSQGYVVRTMVSKPLLMRASDQLLLLSIIDITEWLWASESAPTIHRTNGHSP